MSINGENMSTHHALASFRRVKSTAANHARKRDQTVEIACECGHLACQLADAEETVAYTGKGCRSSGS